MDAGAASAEETAAASDLMSLATVALALPSGDERGDGDEQPQGRRRELERRTPSPPPSMADASDAGRNSPDEQCAWLFHRFDADGDGMLNRVEYKEFLKSIDVWGRSDAYSDVYWGWTWRRICEQLQSAPKGLDEACFARRYDGPGRSTMLATDVARVRSASAAARARRPSETVRALGPSPARWQNAQHLAGPSSRSRVDLAFRHRLQRMCARVRARARARVQMLEVNCAAGHVMPLVPWSAGGHNPVVSEHATELLQQTSFLS